MAQNNKDMFDRQVDFGSSFLAESAVLKLPAITDGGSGDLVGFLVQSLQVQYQQTITKLYEVGGTKIYYVGGRSDGTASLTRIIGPKSITKSFYTQYGNVCNTVKNTIEFDLTGSGGCQAGVPAALGVNAGAKVKYTARHCVITSAGFSVSAQDMLINESVQMRIGALDYEG